MYQKKNTKIKGGSAIGRYVSSRRAPDHINVFEKNKIEPIFIHKSPTSRATCVKCQEPILKGFPRGEFYQKVFIHPNRKQKPGDALVQIGAVPTSEQRPLHFPPYAVSQKKCICYKCLEREMLKNALRYKQEIQRITRQRKRLMRTMRGKKVSTQVQRLGMLKELEKDTQPKEYASLNGLAGGLIATAVATQVLASTVGVLKKSGVWKKSKKKNCENCGEKLTAQEKERSDFCENCDRPETESIH